MKHAWVGLIELFVALLFVIGWGVLELVTSRMDRGRDSNPLDSKGDPGHSKGQ